jgi:excisionase family DNA binding protein
VREEEERAVIAGQLMTVPEVARELRISERTIWRLIRSGKLKPVRLGKRTLVRRDDVEAMVSKVIRDARAEPSQPGACV